MKNSINYEALLKELLQNSLPKKDAMTKDDAKPNTDPLPEDTFFKELSQKISTQIVYDPITIFDDALGLWLRLNYTALTWLDKKVITPSFQGSAQRLANLPATIQNISESSEKIEQEINALGIEAEDFVWLPYRYNIARDPEKVVLSLHWHGTAPMPTEPPVCDIIIDDHLIAAEHILCNDYKYEKKMFQLKLPLLNQNFNKENIAIMIHA